MSIATRPGAKRALSAIASVAAVVAGLLFLITPLSIGGFTDAPPRGADAMGLVVLLIASILAALAQLAACAALALNGRLEGLGWLRGWRAFPVLALAGVAAVGALILWTDRPGIWIVPLGLYCALFAPLAASAMLIASAWREPAAVARSVFMRGANLVAALSAACGLVMGVFGLCV